MTTELDNASMFLQQDYIDTAPKSRTNKELLNALKDAERIISVALRESQLAGNHEVQKQNAFDARGHIGDFCRIIAKYEPSK